MPSKDIDVVVPFDGGTATLKLNPWEKFELRSIDSPRPVHTVHTISVTGGNDSAISLATSLGDLAQAVDDVKSLRFTRVSSSFAAPSSSDKVRITGRVTQMPLGEYMKRIESTEGE